MRAGLPCFLGLGAQKGGTTTLHALLGQHPQLYLPPEKELHYFTLHHQRDESWYRQQFIDAKPGQRCGEITPYYLFHPAAAGRIHRLLPRAKLIVLLRDPVERCLSQVFHAQRLGLEDLDVHQALAAEPQRLTGALERLQAHGHDRSHQEHSYLARSRYEEQLPSYERLFPPQQIFVRSSEALFHDLALFWSELQTFLGVDPMAPPPLTQANAGHGEAAGVNAALRSRLRAQLAPTYRAMEARYGLRW
jgi:hypothetical protein